MSLSARIWATWMSMFWKDNWPVPIIHPQQSCRKSAVLESTETDVDPLINMQTRGSSVLELISLSLSAELADSGVPRWDQCSYRSRQQQCSWDPVSAPSDTKSYWTFWPRTEPRKSNGFCCLWSSLCCFLIVTEQTNTDIIKLEKLKFEPENWKH